MKKANKGFTLVEIMIVVAIIGILVGIAVPGFIKARKQAQGKACSENLAKIDGAKEQWALENNKTSADTPGDTDLYGPELYVKKAPVCPGGGTYTIGAVGTDPSCDSGDQDVDKVLHVLP
ncbi:MAG: competence type IV pilus major pilin ComGC [Candidatus Sumerlaeia bacterium]